MQEPVSDAEKGDAAAWWLTFKAINGATKEWLTQSGFVLISAARFLYQLERLVSVGSELARLCRINLRGLGMAAMMGFAWALIAH